MAACLQAWDRFSRAAANRLADFESHLRRPAPLQAKLFKEVIAAGSSTAFGRAHGFDNIRTLEQYRAAVPIARWSEVSSWIDRAKSESAAILTAEAPIHFERTSGSTARSKDIPYTPALLEQLQRALVVWLAKLHQSCPEIAGPAWWSLSPMHSEPTTARNGIPIGSLSDAVYLSGGPAEALLETVLDTRASLNCANWRLAMLAQAVACEELALISVWSPTYLGAMLATVMAGDRESNGLREIKGLLPKHRFRALVDAIDKHDFSRLWPKLRVISAWTDGPSEAYAAQIAALFSNAHLVPKGLFATEGIISISWGLDEPRPLAIESHFLEFLDCDGNVQQADELVCGRRYEPVISTGGGLYRYALGDLIEVTGFLERTPTVRFVGRVDTRSDLVGEKLDESLVAAAFASAGLTEPAILFPVADTVQPFYCLVLESTGAVVHAASANQLDAALAGSYHYGIARENGQLGPVAVAGVSSLSALIHTSWEALEKCAGDVKSSCLIASPELAAEIFTRCAPARCAQ